MVIGRIESFDKQNFTIQGFNDAKNFLDRTFALLSVSCKRIF